MSIKGRSILGALLLFGGLLLIAGAGVYKSSDRIRYERNIERQKGDLSIPARTGPNVLMIVGGLASVGGLVLIGFAARDMLGAVSYTHLRAHETL